MNKYRLWTAKLSCAWHYYIADPRPIGKPNWNLFVYALSMAPRIPDKLVND